MNNDERRPTPPIHTEKIEVGRKLFYIDLRENDRGRFLIITEDVKGKRDSIMLPMEGLPDFFDALVTIAEQDELIA